MQQFSGSTASVPSKHVAVIGAGVSGLVAAKSFQEKGHKVTGFERSPDIGGVWELSKSYPGIETQSPKDLYCYTDHPMPDEYPEWPTGDQVHEYLKSYVKKHNLDHVFQLNTNVKSMKRCTENDGRGWVLEVESNDDGSTTLHVFDFVVVCTGLFSDKNPVKFPGSERFSGTIMHSSEYKGPEQLLPSTDSSDKPRIVVIGGSKSATDVAVHAAQNGAASVHMVYRRNLWRVPHFIAGLVNLKHLLYMHFQEAQFNGWGKQHTPKGLIGKILASLFRPLIWLNFRGLECLFTYQLGLKSHGMVPTTPIEDQISCQTPAVTRGFFECLKRGDIVPIQSSVEGYDQKSVILKNGERLESDAVILATGWKTGVPYFSAGDQSRLVDEADGQFRLYRLAVNPDIPDLGFVGFNSSFCSVLSSDLIASWLVRYMDGQLARQPSYDEMQADINMMLDWRRKERPSAKVYGGLCLAPFHYQYFAELLLDMGCTKRTLRNPFKEYLSYPRAHVYGEFVASAPQYKAVDKTA